MSVYSLILQLSKPQSVSVSLYCCSVSAPHKHKSGYSARLPQCALCTIDFPWSPTHRTSSHPPFHPSDGQERLSVYLFKSNLSPNLNTNVNWILPLAANDLLVRNTKENQEIVCISLNWLITTLRNTINQADGLQLIGVGLLWKIDFYNPLRKRSNRSYEITSSNKVTVTLLHWNPFFFFKYTCLLIQFLLSWVFYKYIVMLWCKPSWSCVSRLGGCALLFLILTKKATTYALVRIPSKVLLQWTVWQSAKEKTAAPLRQCAGTSAKKSSLDTENESCCECCHRC